MGKSKTTKFRRPQFNSVGLPVNAVKEAAVEEEEHGDDSCPAAELLEKVRHFISVNHLKWNILLLSSILSRRDS